MAMRRVDEFDGVTDAEIVEFSIDGNAYEIDLSKASKDQLHKDLERYINVARKVPARNAKRPSRKSTGTPTASKPTAERTMDNDAIRDWAGKHGMKVSDRGRIPRDVVDAFAEAHKPNGTSPAFSGAESAPA